VAAHVQDSLGVAIASSSGRTLSKTAFSPPTKICSVPAFAPTAMPLTGASRTAIWPATPSPAMARTRSATAEMDVDISTQTEPGARPANSPFSPSSTCSTLAGVGSMVMKSFRMSKSDLQARPIYHRKRDSIEAHLTIVFAALAASRWTEEQTGWSIRKFIKTARRHRTIQIQAGRQTITAPTRSPDDLRQALDAINRDN
jgi:hypothetical protein